jgi:predicted RNA-binding Zn ribbon-like protein
MAVDWNRHRFSGGALALDVANTVVLRADPARRFDRFEDPAELAPFADAAARFRAGELGGAALRVDDPGSSRARMIALREAIDAMFREAAETGGYRADGLSDLLRQCAAALPAGGARLGRSGWIETGGGPLQLETAVALSALSLLRELPRRDVKICANCGWLFVDRSRNHSRLWCDMAVCGNRRKARRHYQRRSAGRINHGQL